LENIERELLGNANWRLVVLVGLPFWASAGAVRTFSLGIGRTTVDSLVAQHLVLTAIALLFYLLSMAIGWPRRRRIAAALQHLVLLAAFAACVPPILLASQTALAFRLATAFDYLVTYTLGLAVILGVRATLALRDADTARAELQERSLRSHLYALRMQMNPHFAFNALNSIAALIDHDSSRARALLFSLSSLYQRTLQASRSDWHSLQEEFAIAREYLDVQSARAAGDFRFELLADDATRACMIPSLLLQPLVENAVLHGVADNRDALCIWVRAWRKGGPSRELRLGVEVGNSTDGMIPLRPQQRGLGLGNTEQRLASLFGSHANMRSECPDVGCYIVHLDLPAVT
jgi:Histidine kinase